MTSEQSESHLDDLLNQHFAGKVVRKDLTKLVKEGANVPVYVLEYLLGMYCASNDEEIIRDGTADAAIGELDDILLAAILDTAAEQNFAVDAELAEFVDQEGEPPAIIVFNHIADQTRLAGTKEAGDYSGGDFLGHGFS